MSKILRWSIFLLIGITLAAFLFRKPLYRWAVHYKVIGQRGQAQAIQPTEGRTMLQEEEVDVLMKDALDTTAAWLHFFRGRVSNAPAQLGPGSPANCIGYSALCSALLLGHLADSGRSGRYAVEQVVCQLHIGAWNVHDAFNSPFWKDHDVVRVTDLSTGERTYWDPTLYDVLGIGRVSGP